MSQRYQNSPILYLGAHMFLLVRVAHKYRHFSAQNSNFQKDFPFRREMLQSLIGSKWFWNIVSIYSRKVILVNKHEDSVQCLGFSRLTPLMLMGPCCQIPNLHPGYLLQSVTVEIEMCFPNQGWSWDGISAWSERDSVADAWGPKYTQNDGMRGFVETCFFTFLPSSVQIALPNTPRGPLCSPSKLTSHHFSLWTPNKTKISQFSTMSPVCWCALCVLRRVWLFVAPLTVAYQAPLSTEFSSQEYWSGLPFSALRYLPKPRGGILVPFLSCTAGRQVLCH